LKPYQAQHFELKELVPPGIMEVYKESAWLFFDDRLLIAADLLRESFGPMYVNTWGLSSDIQKAYGVRISSGLRLPWMSENYKLTSQHSHGRALDALFKDATAQEVRLAIKSDRERFGMITEIEEGVDWLHFGTRNTGGELYVF
jgi:hypothetical protein